MSHHDHHPEPTPLPSRLTEVLRAAHRTPMHPPELDQRVLRAFERHHAAPTILARLRPRRVLAAVAVLGLAAGAWLIVRAANYAPGDLNRDHRVDILDAMSLAIAAGDGRQVPDINRDNLQNVADADALVRQVVMLAARGST